MALLSAREAARRLNRDERTIRRWIAAGKLTPRQAASNRLAIDEGEIERLAARLTQADQEKRQAFTDLEARILHLEQEQARILARLALLEDRAGDQVSIARPDISAPVSRPRPHARPRSAPLSLATPADIPPGSRQATEFAAAHQVNRVTFRDHMTLGIRGDLVEHIARPKPNKPRETERWLSPEQQQAAIAFWNEHGTSWRRCDDPACLVCGSGESQNEQGQLPGFDAPGER